MKTEAAKTALESKQITVQVKLNQLQNISNKRYLFLVQKTWQYSAEQRSFRKKSQICSAKVSNSSTDRKYKSVAGKILYCNQRDKETGHIIQNLVILNHSHLISH